MPPRGGPLRAREITSTAKAAVDTLSQMGLNCCLFGSAACLYYGLRYRVPNDVDVVVMEDPDHYDVESIKEQIVDTNPNFYLVDARDSRDTYKVLWYRLPGPRGSGRCCKVDVLLPGYEPLCIPFLGEDDIYRTRSSGMPLVPFLTLILLKLRGWSDHRSDHRRRMNDKVPQDEDDLEELLELAIEEKNTRVEDEEDLWESWFWDEAQDWIQEYIDQWPHTYDSWSQIFNHL